MAFAVAAVAAGALVLNQTGGLPSTRAKDDDGCRREVTFTVNWAFKASVASNITWGVKGSALREQGIPTPLQRHTKVPCGTDVELHARFTAKQDPGALLCAITANNVVHEPKSGALRDARGTVCSVEVHVI